MPIFKRRREDVPLGQSDPAKAEPVAKPTSEPLVEAARTVVVAYEADPMILGGNTIHTQRNSELPNPARRVARQALAAAILALKEALAGNTEG